MAAVSELLANEREDLAGRDRAAQRRPGRRRRASCGTTPTLLTTNVNRLADVTLVLVQQRAKLAEVLDVAPAALGNLARAYNPDFGTLDTRDNGLGSLNAGGRRLRRARPGSAGCDLAADLPLPLPVPDPTAPLPGRRRADLRPPALRRRERRREP